MSAKNFFRKLMTKSLRGQKAGTIRKAVNPLGRDSMSLEDRVVPAVFAPGTPMEYVEQVEAALHGGNPDVGQFQLNSRWTSTATNAGPLGQGDATVLRWSFLPDGVNIPSGGVPGEVAAPSSLIARLDALLGAGPGGSDLTQRPWFASFQSSVNRNAAVSGLTYVYEPNDDGAAFPGTAGAIGVRGDVRFGGHPMDGASGVLAYNYFPQVGDMVFDTNENTFFTNNLGFRNILMHEQGHGVGLNHEMPTDGTTLMEPFINLGFDGPQLDDVLSLQRHYGDNNEDGAGNDTIGTATPLGSIPIGNSVTRGLSATSASEAIGATATDLLSIDDDSDADVFSFNTSAGAGINITLTPVGPTYLSGSQGGPPPVSFNALNQSDLTLELLDSGGAVLATRNLTGAGSAEVLTNFPSPTAGTLYARVTGAANTVQLYQIQVATVALGSVVSVNGGNLVVAGTAAAEDLTLVRSGTNYRITDPNGVAAGAGATQVNGTTVDVPIASITGNIQIDTAANDDRLTVNYGGGAITHAIAYTAGAGGNDSLALTGGGTFATVTHNFTNANDGSVTPSGQGTISYTGLDPITDNLSATNRIFNFNGGAETITFGDDGGAGNNISRIQSTLGELVDFVTPTASLTVNSNAGPDTINLNAPDSSFGTPTITFNGGSSGNLFNVNATRTATTTTINAGAGTDTVNVGSGNLDALAGAVVVNGEGGTDTVNVNDAAVDFGDTYTITATTVQRAFFGGLTYGTIESLTLNGQTSAAVSNVYNVNSTASGTATTVNAGSGNDTINIGTGNLDVVAGALTVNGQGGTDQVNLNDSTQGFGDTFTITNSTVTRTPAGLFGGLTYGGIEGLALTATGGDTVNVNSTNAGTPVVLNYLAGTTTTNVSNTSSGLTVNGGTGDDTLNLTGTGHLEDIAGAVVFNGNGGTDTVNLSDINHDIGGDTYGITSTTVTRTAGFGGLTYATAEALNLTASLGNDTINITSTLATTPVSVNGNEGSDTFNINTATTMLGAVTIDGGNPTLPTLPGDVLNYDANGLATTVTPTTITSAGRPALTYSNIESAQILNAVIIVDGDANDNSLVLTWINNTTSTFQFVSPLPAGAIFTLISPVSFTYNGLGGDDTFTANFNGGIFQYPITFNGGPSNSPAPGDSMQVTNFNLPGGTVIVTHTNATDGNVRVGLGNPLITFTSLEPLALFGTMANLIVNLPNVAGVPNDNVLLADDGPVNFPGLDFTGSNLNTSALGWGGLVPSFPASVAPTFEFTEFTNPTVSLTVNMGNQGDVLRMRAMDVGYTANTQINGGAGNDIFSLDLSGGPVAETVNFNGGAGNNLLGLNANNAIIGGPFPNLRTTIFASGNDQGVLVTDPDDSAGQGAPAIFLGTDASVVNFSNTQTIESTIITRTIDYILTVGADTGILGDALTSDNLGAQSQLVASGSRALQFTDLGGTFADLRFTNSTNLRLMGNSGADQFVVNYGLLPLPTSFTNLEVYGHFVPGLNPFVALPADDNASDRFTLTATGPGTTNLLNGQGGNDDFGNVTNLLGANFFMENLLGPTTITGGAGTDRMAFSNFNGTAAETVTVNATTLASTQWPNGTLTYDTLESVLYTSTQLNDTINVLSTQAGTLYRLGGDSGSDVLTVGNTAANFGVTGGNLAPVAGAVTFLPEMYGNFGILGTDTLNVDASGMANLNGTASITNIGNLVYQYLNVGAPTLQGQTTQLFNFGPAAINYIHNTITDTFFGARPSFLTNLNVRASMGNDTILVNDTTAIGTTTLSGRDGNDAVTINADNLSANNVFRGDDVVGAVPAVTPGNDEFTLNIASDIGASAAFPVQTLLVEGDNNTGGTPNSANRDRLVINDNNANARNLSYTYLDSLAGDVNVSGFLPNAVTGVNNEALFGIDDGQISLATNTGITATGFRNQFNITNGAASIGDGPFGGTSGDFDWYSLTAAAGQVLTVQANGNGSFASTLDTFIEVRDAAGNILTTDDDSGPGFDSFLNFTVPADGTYFIVIRGFSSSQANPNNSGSGGGVGSTGLYGLSISVADAPGATRPQSAIQSRSMETIVFNSAGAANDTVRVFGTTAASGSNDLLTTTLLPSTAAQGVGGTLRYGTSAASSVGVFLGGNPFLQAPGVLASFLPGLAGGGTTTDMIINGINPNFVGFPFFSFFGGLTVDGNGAPAGGGDRAIVYAASELPVVDVGNGVNVFGFGAGVIQPGFGGGNAYDTINVTDARVQTVNNSQGQLATVNFVTGSFVQTNNTLAGLTVDSGDEAGFAANGIADNITATMSANYRMVINGGNPAPGFGLQGDQLNVLAPNEINIYSDLQNPPNVSFTSTGFQEIGFSSIERLILTPGNGIVNVLGDNNNPATPQADTFIIQGDGRNTFDLSINGSAPIQFLGTFTLNVNGGQLDDTTAITAFATATQDWNMVVTVDGQTDGANGDRLIYTDVVGIFDDTHVQATGLGAGRINAHGVGAHTTDQVVRFLGTEQVTVLANVNEADALTLDLTNNADAVTFAFDPSNPVTPAVNNGTGLPAQQVALVANDVLLAGLFNMVIDTTANTGTGLVVNGSQGADSFTVDLVGAGTLPLALTVNGGVGGNDSITLQGNAGDDTFGNLAGALAADGFASIGGTDTALISYTGVEALAYNGGGGGADVVNLTGTSGNDSITVNETENLPAGSATIDNQPAITFSAIGTAGANPVRISALGGDDEITINQAVVWGITGVSVDGGPPTGSDTLQVNGTASPDDFTFDPTTRVVTVSPNSANKVTYTTTNVEKFVLDGAAPSVLPGDVLTVASTMVGTASLPNGTLTASGLTLNYQNFERIVVDAVPTLASDANTPAGNGAALPRLIEDSTVILDILANDTFAASIGIGGATIQLATTPTNGTVVILLANDPANPTSVSPLTAHQVIRYTPAANFFGVDSFTYRAVDRLGQVSVATTTVTVTVNPVNDQPTFNLINTPVTVAENDTGATLTAQVATNISVGPANEVAAGQTPTFVVTNSNNALFATQPTISPTGQLSYVLAADQNGSATITVFMQDGGGTADGGVDTSPTFQFVLNVTPVNDAPTLTAAADVVTNEDTAVAVPGIVVNDVDSAVPVATNFDVTVTLALTQPAIGTLTAQPANGVTVSGNGSANLSISGPRTLVNAVLGTLLYTPNLNQNGVDTITVTVDDQGNIGGGNLTATDTITVTVNAVNDAPVATGESYTTNEDVALVVAAPGVLANDTDVDGPAQTAVLVTGAANGVVVLNLDGSFTYTPNVDFNGTDSFTYQVDDTAGANNLSNIVTVTITVTAVNDAPVNGVPGAQATNEDTALVFTGANALTVSDPSDGNQGELTVTITVTNGTFSLFSVAGLTAVGGNGTDTVIATGTVAALNAALNGSSYTPSLNYFGGALLTLTTNDNGNVGTGPAVGLSDSDTVAITVNAVNDAPVASPDVYTTLEDTTLTVPAAGVLTNDTDVDGPAQTAVLVTTTANGALTLNADGSFTYAPNLNFNGTDSFTYRANDTAGANNLSNIVTVTINVTAVNDTPVNTLPAQVGTEDTTTPVVGLAVTDVDSLAGDVTVTLDVTNGTLAGTGFTPASGATISFTGTQAAVNAALATVSFTPSLNFNGVATLTMTTTDNGNTGIGGPLTDTDVTTITVAAVNDAPVATNSVATVAEDNFVDVDLKPLVSDVETPVANLIFNVGVSTNGVTIDLGNGVFRFIPDFNYSGPASFTYSVTDTGDNGSPALTSNVATVSVTVTPVADAPTLTVTSPVAGNEGAAIPLTITAAPTDPSETVTVSITGFPAGTVFNRGINDGVTVELTTAQLAGLTVTFPDGAVGGTVYNLQVTAISTESDGSTANTPIAPATNLVVTVNNVNPTGTLVNGGPVNEGSTGTVTFTAQADPAQDDVVAGFHYAYDFNNDGTFEVGNGTYAGSPSTASATVPASFFSDGPGTRTVRARIIDKDGGFTDSTTTITIDNVAPTATFGVGAPLIPGQPVAVSFSNQADPSAADVAAGFTYQYDLGNGVFGAVTTSATATFTPPAPGTYTIRGRIIDKDGGVTEYTAGGNALVVVPNVDMYAVGSGNGGGPIVNVYRASDNTLVTTIVAYEPQFRGGVNVAVADVTGDGIPDIITGTGVGGGPVVKVFDGKDFSLVSSFFAAEPTFRGGVRVAAGDISGTGVSSVVTGSGDGGGPVVRTFTGLGTQLSSFFAYAPTFRGGVNVGVAKLAATGPASILTGAGFGGGPNVKVFNATGTQQQSFFAYESTFTGGVYVSGGFVNGAGAIYTGTGLGGGAVLKQFSATGVEQKSQAAFGLDAYGRQLRDGFTVSATHIAGANGRPVVIVGAGPNYGPTVRVLDAATLTQDAEFLPYEESFTGGVYVG